METFHTIIIGGGPAGLFSAISIGRNDTLVLEKNTQPGRKLLIAGSGRCNITHDGDITNFFHRYGDHGSFVKRALKEFTNLNLINFFALRGLNTITDKNGKVFPQTEKAEDVLNSLLRECQKVGVTINTSCSVTSVERNDGFFLLKTSLKTFSCENLVIATGGNSYPTTGSSGDGYTLSKMLGHAIVPIKPALTPIFVKNYRMEELSGVSLADIPLYLFRNGKKIHEHRGDIGFTHKGISGPGIIDFSRYFEAGDVLMVNLIDCNEDKFRKLFIDTAVQDGSRTIQSLLRNYELPKSLMRIVLDEVGVDPAECLSNINAKRRGNLVSLFCCYPFEIERVGGFKIAMTTAGGVSLNEVSSKTMESKLVSRLYFAGEVLDIDGDSGGYNIQAAFSTAHLVGKAIRTLE
ncbi:BaiN/RdsA family NAD(P)/FAD-dependent oxidoreductase [Williamwhitmania taraxaci]|uniref:Flavoprotein, HI0933 family n=1 Tax=Williamwhitmania taraxaci TaxID=1640674 RepID=A0A1G6SFH1_9BACT|nr:NAD(P)/FAD-dependent oxidoreductase [Williamwhitmania taraxaci]SDD15401.1 hypothetical protein SAMN05216323_10938 [Williamwhitmania taraxaci]